MTREGIASDRRRNRSRLHSQWIDAPKVARLEPRFLAAPYFYRLANGTYILATADDPNGNQNTNSGSGGAGTAITGTIVVNYMNPDGSAGTESLNNTGQVSGNINDAGPGPGGPPGTGVSNISIVVNHQSAQSITGGPNPYAPTPMDTVVTSVGTMNNRDPPGTALGLGTPLVWNLVENGTSPANPNPVLESTVQVTYTPSIGSMGQDTANSTPFLNLITSEGTVGINANNPGATVATAAGTTVQISQSGDWNAQQSTLSVTWTRPFTYSPSPSVETTETVAFASTLTTSFINTATSQSPGGPESFSWSYNVHVT